MAKSGVAATELYDFDADSGVFSSALDAARAADTENGWCVTPQSKEQLKGKKTYMDAGGTIGFALTKDGDIEAVFKNKAKNHTRRALDGVIPQAIADGGVKLDCYGEGLVATYERYGFIPVARCGFAAEFANDVWDASKGEPDVYFMVHNGDSAETVAQNIGKYGHLSLDELHALPYFNKNDYQKAYAYRDSLLAAQNAKNNPQAAQGGETADWYEARPAEGGVHATESVGAAPAGFDKYSQALNEYGAIEAGENPARTVDVPKSVDGKTKVTRLTRTAMEAGVTGESTMLPAIEDAVVNGAFNRMPQKNAARKKAAEEWLSQRSVTQATSEWIQTSKRRVSAESQARGLMLYAKLSQLAEDTSLPQREREIYRDMGLNVLRQLSIAAAEAGDTVQINRLLKQLSPDAQIEMLLNNITELEEFINKRTRKGRKAMKQAAKDTDAQGTGGTEATGAVIDGEAGATRRRRRAASPETETDIDGEAGGIRKSGNGNTRLFRVNVNETLLQAWKDAMKAGDEAKAQEAKDALYHDIAAQTPKTFMDRWNAWRYLCMLGNIKTPEKNLIGNVGMTAAQHTADKVAAGLEAVLVKDKSKRTKYGGALRATEQGRAMLDYVRETVYPEHRGTLKGERKYADETSAMLADLISTVREGNARFTAPVLKQWQALTDYIMNNELFGDEAFLRKNFVDSFANAAMARGWTAEQLAGGEIAQEEVDALSSYAIRRAKQATFRDINALTQIVKNIRANNAVADVAISGVLPFKATPANVAVRGIEYSPIGLLNGITQLFKVWTDDKMAWKNVPDLTTAIENVSQGAVGTALFALGALGAAKGVLHAQEDDDEDRTGIQGYSIELFGHTFTLDALSPAVIPLMMGVSATEALGSGAGVLESILQAGLDSFQPMLEMTMLSGISDMIDGIRYGDSDDDIFTIANTVMVQPFISYLSQGIPTLASQVAQITRPYQTSTYTGDITSSKLRPSVRSLLNAAKKIPGLDYAAGLKQTLYVDEWGRANYGGNVAQRAVTALISPTYTSEVKETAADKEIARLIQTTGDTGVRPKKPGYKVTLIDEDGESAEKRLNEDEYELYATVKGQTALSLVETLLNDAGYQALADADKAAAIKDAYTLADALGKTALGIESPQEGWTKELQDATTAEAAAELAWRALEGSELRDVFKDSALAGERIGSGERTIGELEAPKSVTIGEGGESYRLDAEDYEQYRDAYLSVWEETDTEDLTDRQRARLHNIAVAAGKAAALADEGVDYEEESISANYKTARDAGISSEAYLAAWSAKEEIADTVDMGGRAKAFRHWLETDGKEYNLTKTQKSTLEDLYKSYMMAPETTGNYGEMLDAGISEAKAKQISDRIDALQPESGKKSVSDKQKAQAIIKGNYSGKETYLAVKAYISSTTGEKLTQAYEEGVTAKQFVQYWYEADADGNGSVSRAEACAWLDRSGLKRRQKALLLRLRNANWTNPYE